MQMEAATPAHPNVKHVLAQQNVQLVQVDINSMDMIALSH
jgi:hypothetical protein